MSEIALNTPEIQEGIPVESWTKFRKKARENTASGPSVLNFSVLKAGAHSDLLATFDSTMSEIPMVSGYSPMCWKQATDVVLLKKAGVFLAHKLRMIVLFQPDFNYMNKITGRKTMQNATHFGHLAKEQYGSCQGS